jgi:hypothetical protein
LKIYEKLKASVTHATHAVGKPMEPVDTLKYDKYSVAPDSAGSQKMLKIIMMKIIKNKRRRLEYFLILGTELANLKFKSFTNKCRDCQPVNMYAVLKCKLCTKRNKCKKFFETVADITGYKASIVNFLIAISNLGKLYPKFLCATMSTANLKEIGTDYLGKKMHEDASFWKS